MIVKLFPAGKSFKGLGLYLGRDPKAETSERVNWAMTLNCANSDAALAIDEMLWTFRDAELIKEEAGIQGGHVCEKPVKHFSLNWAPEQSPTREDMVFAVDSYLRHMGWSEHQAVIYNHIDKSHDHVHVMLNMVHPETGKCLDDSFEKRRSQKWALQYEREVDGKIYCEQRLKGASEREDAPTREKWMALKDAEQNFLGDEARRREYDPDYLKTHDNLKVINSEEWGILKRHQREERKAFFESGREEFMEVRKRIFYEVREHFREEWADYYAARKAGADREELSAWRRELIEAQKGVLTEMRDDACGALREDRDAAYKALLEEQKAQRHLLHDRQDEGLTSPHLLELLHRTPGEEFLHRPQEFRRDNIVSEFGIAAERATERAEPEQEAAEKVPIEIEAPSMPAQLPTGVRPGIDIGLNLGFGVIGGLADISESLFDGFFGGDAPKKQPAAPKPPVAERDAPSIPPAVAAAEEVRRRAEREREDRDDEWWKERRDRGRE